MKAITTFLARLTPLLLLSNSGSAQVGKADPEDPYEVDCSVWASDCNGIGRFPNDNVTQYGNQCWTNCLDTGFVNSTCVDCRSYWKCHCVLKWFTTEHQQEAEGVPLTLIREALGKEAFKTTPAFRYQIRDGKLAGLQAIVDN